VQVGVVARVPDHPVVACVAEDLVVAVAAGEGVVAIAAVEYIGAAFAQECVISRVAVERVGSRPTGDDVVAVTAGEPRGRQGAVSIVECDRVVAALAEYLDHRPVRHGWARVSPDREGSAVDLDGSRGVAGNGDGVVEIITGDAEGSGGSSERGGDGWHV